MAEKLSATGRAVRAAAELVRWAWGEAVAGTTLSASQQAAYRNGLEHPGSIVHPDGGDELQARVILQTSIAATLENGHEAYHLPERINWGAALGVKTGKRGLYLIVPFKHLAYKSPKNRGGRSLPNMLRSAVYEVARRLRPGQFLTAGPSHGQAVHAPGLMPYRPAFARNVRPGYTHAAREERLRRVQSGKQSTYLTFRTMTPSSPGWWIPAQPGVKLRGEVERQTAPAVRAMIAAGIRQDAEEIAVRKLNRRGR